ncbi:MAG: gliding motility-associated C-terminal domain-containing protein [Bacteroidales bacterium]|nr:gliding motility-associated C-terminal domain-containing protein [Bacteroidales bacterium]
MMELNLVKIFDSMIFQREIRVLFTLVILLTVSQAFAQDPTFAVYHDGAGTLTLCNNLILNNNVDSVTNVLSVPQNNITGEETGIFVDDQSNFNINNNSSAVDAGSDACVSWLLDFCGVKRVYGEAVDVGAFEVPVIDTFDTYTVFQEDGGELLLYNNIVVNNTGVTSNANATSVHHSNLLQDMDNVFVSAEDFNLAETSPAVNAGDNQYVVWMYDLKMEERIPCQGVVDQGAFELQPGERSVSLTATTEMNAQCGYITTIVATGGQHYRWSHSNETTDTVIVNPLVTTCYTATAYWDGDCPWSDTATICVDPTESVENTLGSPSTAGQRFWVSFMKNYTGSPSLSLLVSAQTACTGTITNPNTGWSRSFSVAANHTTQVSIPNVQAYCSDASAVGNYGLLVTATENISLYASNFEDYTYDVTNVLPEPALSSEYVVQTYTPLINSEFMIVATQNGTTVKITPSKSTIDNRPAFVPYYVTLNAGQTYQVLSKYNGINGDLSGSTIESLDAAKPVAVFNGNVCANIPEGNRWCDHVVEQAFGTHFWGHQFVVTNTVGMPYDRVKITASADNTVITKNGNYLTTLQANRSYEFRLTSGERACFLEANNACAVYLYVVGGEVNPHADFRGDPSMVWISPLEQRIQEITFSTFNSTNITSHYVNVIVPSTSVSSVTCDNVSVSSQFQSVPSNPAFSYARLHINNGTHTLNSSQGFVAHVYGTGHCETYAYSVGSKAAVLSQNMYVNQVISTELEDNNFCTYETITFDASVNYQCDSVVWNFGDSYDNYNGMHFTHYYETGGIFPVSMTIFMYDSYGQHCTTIYSQLVIHEGEHMVYYDTVCQGTHYMAHGFDYMANTEGPTTLTRTVDIPNLDCDSTYVAELFVTKAVFDLYDTICAGNDYHGYGFSLPAVAQGVYTLTDTISRASCDSIVVLHLLATPNTNNLYGIHGMEYVCPGGVYTYWLDTLSGLTNINWTMPQGAYLLSGQGSDHAEITFSDEAVDGDILVSGTNSCGVASFSLTIHPKPMYYFQLMDTVCGAGQPYHRYGFDIDSVTEDHTVFVNNMVSEYCCDSTVLLTLVVIPMPEVSIQADAYQICQYDTQELSLVVQTESTAWEDSVNNVHYSCLWSTGDSARTIVFSSDTSALVSVEVSNIYGCSITVDTLMTVFPVHVINDTVDICENRFPFTYADTVFGEGTLSGDYMFSGVDIHGCDSVHSLHLTVLPVSSHNITDTILAQYLPYVLNDSSYTETGEYTQHLVNQHGCDSTLTLQLYVSNAVQVYDTNTVCASELPLIWNEIVFDADETDPITQSIVHTATLTASSGVDSIVVMTLWVKAVSYTEVYELACDSLTWINGITYYESTDTGRLVLTAANGCDSIVALHLTLHHGTHHVLDTTVCESYTWVDGTNDTYTSTGTYTHVYANEYGCSSVDTLHLVVNFATHEDTIIVACDSCVWHDSTYFTSGTYTYAYANEYGCYSVDTLHLTINIVSPVYITGSSLLCEDSMVVLVADSSASYLWSTGENTRAIQVENEGSYSVTVTDGNGCTSTAWHHIAMMENTILSVDIPEICSGESYTLTVGYDSENNIQLYKSETSLSRGEVIFLPDGIYCEPYGSSYRSYVNFTAFAPDAIITSADDILYLRMKIEHSAIEDLRISLVCPNGSRCKIVPDYQYDCWGGVPHNFRTNLGVANRLLEVVSCNASQNPMGIAWNYVWSNNTTLGYQYANTPNSYCYEPGNVHSSANPYWDDGSTSYKIDSTDVANMTQVYHPLQSFAGMVGCPLNGNWYIEVEDLWEADNGYLQEWELALNPETLPIASLEYDYVEVEGPWGNTLNDSSFVINPPADLERDTVMPYTFTVYYENGCRFDTIVEITFHAKNHTLIDTMVCDMFTWNGVVYTESESISQTNTNIYGCDSIVTLHLTVNHKSYGDTTAVACESFTWHGVEYTETPAIAPTYTIVGGNHNGCDSIVTLHLTVNHKTYGDTTAVACESFTWHGVEYTETPAIAPTYTIVGGNHNGCDSIVTLHLTVNHKSYGDTTAVACESFIWYGVEYTETPAVAPTYTIVGGNQNGCDSVVALHLIVNHKSYGDTTAVACESFTWHGVEYNETPSVAPTYTIDGGGYNGCDSIVTLHLTINHATNGDTMAVACESFTWHGVDYTETPAVAPTYTIVGGAHNGCDSIVTLHLTVNHKTYGDTTAVVCESFTWHGVEYTETPAVAPTYTIVGGNYNGCDSIVTLHLTVNHKTYGDTTAVACESFTWHGVEYTETPAVAPTYTIVGGSHNGCDSVVTLHLTVNHKTYGDTIAVACESFTWHGAEYTETPAIVPTYTIIGGNHNGCDSIVALYLTVNHATHGDTTAVACESFTWHGVEYNETPSVAPTYTIDGGGYNGCDSIVTLHLTINHATNGDTMAVACESFTWHGVDYTETPAVAPTYTIVGGAHNGCDSIVTLHLTVNHKTYGDTTAVACESFTWHGVEYNETPSEAPTYTIVGGNHNGCDSVVTLHLTVNHKSYGDTTAVACESFTWHGVEYAVTPAVAPTYTIVGGNHNGCDSTVTLHLTVNHKTYGDTTAVACESFTWHEVEYTETPAVAPTYTIVGGNHNGCDSIVTLHLTVNHKSYGDTTAVACESFIWHGVEYTETPAVAPTYTIVGGNQNGCDSIITLHLTVNHKTYGDTTAVACESFTWHEVEYTETPAVAPTYTIVGGNHNGCDSIVTLHLTVNHKTYGDTTAVACESFTWHGVEYNETPSVAPTYTIVGGNHNGCDSVVTLQLIVNPVYELNLEDVVCEGDGYANHGFVVSAFQTIGVSDLNLTKNLQSQSECDSVVNLHLTVVDTNIAIVSLTQDFCDEFFAELSVETNMTNYVWSTGETSSTIMVTQPDIYTVTATQGNCSVSAWYQIEKCELNFYLPNAITPGLGDGLNDYFCIHDKYKSMITDFEIHIYSRWGELVFYSNDKDFKWNGECNGRINRNVIYTYLINFIDNTGIPYQFKGSITVL